jgi:UDP:flavonoid glycosyltransferase YjiC (YdhE family)
VADVLLVLWDGGGNANPFLGLAEQLRARGHGVRALAPRSLRARFEAVGATVVERTPPEWDPAHQADEVATTAGPTEKVVVDCMLPGAIVGAERSGRPYAVLVHILLHANLTDDGELGPMGMAASPAAIAAVADRPVEHLADLLWRAPLVLVTAPEALDVPGPARPNVHHVGPIMETAGADAGWQPPPGDGPLVVVGLGTTPMDEGPVLDRVLAALAGHRVAATAGAHLGRADLPAYVHHAAVLPHAAALVCHAGLSSVLRALHHGVPMVCIPLGREQPANAAAAARAGAAVVVDRDADEVAIAAAVDRALSLRPAPIPDGGPRAVDLLLSL